MTLLHPHGLQYFLIHTKDWARSELLDLLRRLRRHSLGARESVGIGDVKIDVQRGLIKDCRP